MYFVLDSNGNHKHGEKIWMVIGPPKDNSEGLGYSFGFSVVFSNPLSKISVDPETKKKVTVDQEMLDPAPDGTGKMVNVTLDKWKYNWVKPLNKHN